MTNVLGTDVSFYEDDQSTSRHIDFALMRSAGVRFTVIRAGQNLWVDPSYSTSWVNAKAAGLPRGSYWFYDSRVHPVDQAALWISVVQREGDMGELPLFADFEESYKGQYAGGSNFRLFLEEVKRLVPQKEIVIYTGYYYWIDNVSDSLHEYFSQYALWIAAYGTDAPMIPAPWTNWLFWQYTDKGAGATYGTEGNVDLNYFNGDQEAFNARFGITQTEPEESGDFHKQTHAGVVMHSISRFGANCVVHVIDPTVARVFVTGGGYMPVGAALRKYGAQVGVNGGGWPDKQTVGHRTNEAWVSDGKILQATAIDNRGYIEVDKNGKSTIHERADSVQGKWNVWGFDRILGKNGVFNPLISDRTVKDARTGSGVTANGLLIILSAEGNDRYSIGLTFPEMWEVFKEFGAVIAGNNDGGSSSAVVNTAISPESLIMPSDGVQANVINHVLIFSQLSDEVEIPPEETGDSMQYKIIRSARFRSIPSTTTSDTGASSVVDELFESSVTKVDSHNAGITMVQHPNGKWLPLTIANVIYTEAQGVVEPPPDEEEDPIVQIISVHASGKRRIWLEQK